MRYSPSDFFNLAFGLTFVFLARVVFQVSKKQEKEYGSENRAVKALKDFMWASAGMGVFQTLIGTPPLLILFNAVEVDTYLQLYGAGFYIGIIPIMMGVAFLLAMASDFYFPKTRTPILALGMILSIALMIILFITPPSPTRLEGVTFANLPNSANAIIGLFGTLGTAIASITFAYTGLKETVRRISRTRSLFLAIGFMLIAVSGPMHLFTKEPMHYFFLDSLQLIGDIIIAMAILVIK